MLLCLFCHIGDWTFQEAYDRFGRIANITGWIPFSRPHSANILYSSFTVSDHHNKNQPMLLNFLTAPNVRSEGNSLHPVSDCSRSIGSDLVCCCCKLRNSW